MRPFLTLHNPAAAQKYYQDKLWFDETFYDLATKHATARPHALALQDGFTKLTWQDVIHHADALARDLIDQGLCGGDRVSVWMSDCITPVIALLACSREGFVCNPSLHKTHTWAEIIERLNRLNTKAFITQPGWGADPDEISIDNLYEQAPSLKVIYEPDTLPKPVKKPDHPPSKTPDHVTYLAFTSGTTGEPKGVMHSANTLLSSVRKLVETWGFDTQTRILTLSPLSHHIAWVAASEWLVCGGVFITNHPPPDVHALDWIVQTGATYVLGVPTHAMDILAEQARRNLPRLGNVSVFYLAGSPIPPSVAEAFIKQGITPQNVYGMTENSSHQYTFPDDSFEIIVGTCGRGGPAYDVCILDPDNPSRYLKTGETGHIAGRGAALMLGYFDNQSASESSFNQDGWFMSGDLGSLDEAGNLTIKGRIKDLIIRGGHNIHPAPIEAVALRHPAVEKAAVFPVPDDRLGEKICIAIIGRITINDLLEHLRREGLSKYDMPEYFARVEAFPLTASGKVLKRTLIDQHRRGELTVAPIKRQTSGLPS